MKNGSFTFTYQQKAGESATFGHNKKVKKMQKLEQYCQVMTHYIPHHAILTEND